MIEAFNEFGKPIGAYFESLCCWYIDTGIFYLSGRDIEWMIVGFLICLVLWGIFDGKEIGGGNNNNNRRGN